MRTEVIDFDRTAPILGPFGDPTMKESACIQNGKCSSDSLFFSGSQVGEIARCALDTFDRHLNVTMMWTAHNEIEAKWDYVKAWDLTWINKTEVPAD